MSYPEIIEKELSYQIIQAAYEVFNALGPGFVEKIYEGGMYEELLRRNHKVERQKRIPIYFKGKQIGIHVLDLLVDERVILELKAVAEISPIHKKQALSYLKATGLELALIINFGANRMQSSRVVHTKRIK